MYSYDNLVEDLKAFSANSAVSVGKSLFGRDIWALTVGDGVPRALIHGGIHGREHITCRLVIELAKQYRGAAVMFVPMVNPDGVEIAVNGLDSVPRERREYLQKVNGRGSFKLWKANGRAVDLNVNFDALWGRGDLNITKPAPANYIGAYPHSEPETRVLSELTEKYKFTATISYHCKGRVIYYGFENYPAHLDKVSEIVRLTGYTPLTSRGSAGGYKDWYLKRGFGFGVTVEVGDDSLSHPLSDSSFKKIWNENNGVAEFAARTAGQLWMKNL